MSVQSNYPNLRPSLLLDFANTRQLDSRVTFTRSTPAVYYDGETTAMAEQNLLYDSQVLNAANWLITNNCLVTGNTTTAPDGTSTADTLSATGSSVTTGTPTQTYQFVNSVDNQSFTASIYAKANTSNFVYFREYFSHNTEDVTWFNLSTGAVGTTSANHTASIVSVGSGWYRCVITTKANGTRSQSLGIGVSDANNSYNITTSSSVYLWGAQLEQRSSATAYTVTTTQRITNYIPVLLSAGGNQARFDCNPTTGESLGLLIEEARTNTVTQSQSFSTWNKVGSPTFTTEIIAPDGTLTAQKVTATLTNSNTGAYFTTTSNTISIYAKAAGKNFITFVNASGSNFVAWFNIGAGTLGTIGSGYTASITSVGNGWYRCSLTVNSGSFSYHQFAICDADNDSAVTANAINGVCVWGAQAENGSFSTSYIATTSANATRTADVAQMTGTNFSSWFNNAQGTFVATVSAGVLSNGARICKVSDTDANRLIDFYVSGTSQGIFSYQNGITSANFSSGTIGTTKYLTSVSYLTGNISGVVNGGTVTTSTSAVVSSVANSTFAIGYDPITGAQLSRPIAKIAYYPIQVTSANLQALTS